MKVLVTGGLGFIGSHTVVQLLENGMEIVIVDNLYNSKIDVLDRIEEITHIKPKFYNEDVTNLDGMDKIFKEEKFDAIIHFAGYKAVGESCVKPLMYYRNNLDSTLTLLELMEKYHVNNMVFSSSATIYGIPDSVPLTESSPRKEATSPYGETKVMIERILEDVSKVHKEFNIAILRYFNPIGAHKSHLLGEDPNGLPNNLLPYINKVAVGLLPFVNVYGDDYDTVDGTGVRDYIHVVDLAKGHIKAIERANKINGVEVYNLGTGKGYSVLDIVKNFEKATGIKIKYEITPRRAGDIATCYADPSKAEKVLGWKAEKSLEDMCKDSWKFTQNNV